MHLQLASSDALARLCSPPSNLDDSKVKEAFNVYFEEQEHFCLSDCLQKYLQADEDCETGKLMQVMKYFIYFFMTVTFLLFSIDFFSDNNIWPIIGF